MAAGPRRTAVRPARVPLSHERILDAAARLVGEGASSFSMRQLAERLGVTPMAIYTWFPNREELLAALAAREMGAMAMPEASAGAWIDRALALADAVRAHVLAHREAVLLPEAASALTVAMLTAADRGLALMLELGYDDVDAVEHFRAFYWHVMGHALVVDVGRVAPAAGGEPLEARFADVLARFEATETATLRRLLPLLDAFDADAVFTRSTRLLLSAIEAAAPTRPAPEV